MSQIQENIILHSRFKIKGDDNGLELKMKLNIHTDDLEINYIFYYCIFVLNFCKLIIFFMHIFQLGLLFGRQHFFIKIFYTFFIFNPQRWRL